MRPRTFWLGFLGICLALPIIGAIVRHEHSATAPPPPDISWIVTAAIIVGVYFLPALIARRGEHR
ncbi:MAG: hypothetical protein ACREFH_01045, partial [Stellaceae bacterium]